MLARSKPGKQGHIFPLNTSRLLYGFSIIILSNIQNKIYQIVGTSSTHGLHVWVSLLMTSFLSLLVEKSPKEILKSTEATLLSLFAGDWCVLVWIDKDAVVTVTSKGTWIFSPSWFLLLQRGAEERQLEKS